MRRRVCRRFTEAFVGSVLKVLAIDVGSTRLKAALLDDHGLVLSSVNNASPLSAATVNADDVLQATGHAAVAACEGTQPDAIAITAATRTSVFTNADGRALGDIIKLNDSRGDAYATVLQQAYGAPTALGFGAFHPLARALDARDNDAQRYQQTSWLLDLKDWLNLRLTGHARGDNVAWMRVHPDQGDMAALLDALGLKQNLLAQPLDAATTLGTLQKNNPGWPDWQGVPVIECGFDAWCATYGMGCVGDEAAYNVCGTTDVFGSFSHARKSIPGVSCLPWGSGLNHIGGPSSTGLATLAWFGEKYLNNAEPLQVLACAATANDNVPLCLPFVSGERMPFWRADLTPEFIGVAGCHGTPEMARALVDGLLAYHGWLLGLIAPAPQAVYLGGGGAGLPGWAQLKASAYALPIRLPGCAEPSLLGAALCAQVALGKYASLDAAQKALVPGDTVVHPDALASARLHAVRTQLTPHFEKLYSDGSKHQ